MKAFPGKNGRTLEALWTLARNSLSAAGQSAEVCDALTSKKHAFHPLAAAVAAAAYWLHLQCPCVQCAYRTHYAVIAEVYTPTRTY